MWLILLTLSYMCRFDMILKIDFNKLTYFIFKPKMLKIEMFLLIIWLIIIRYVHLEYYRKADTLIFSLRLFIVISDLLLKCYIETHVFGQKRVKISSFGANVMQNLRIIFGNLDFWNQHTQITLKSQCSQLY